MLLGILVFSNLLLLISVLIWAFVSFGKLVKLQHDEFPDEWEKDGQPFGVYLDREKTRSIFRSGIAGQWIIYRWFFRKPEWIRSSKQASMLLWQTRILVGFWNVGFVFLFLIMMFFFMN